ncbi:MAG TPA: pitrilysin family protein, partial [Vicinamibacterales bacterium]|nr:pitrilysin family protein [Vicinamibacterales bacterium]
MMAVDRSRLPAPGPPRPFAFPSISQTALANGLDLRVVAHDTAPVVSMAAVVRGGSSADPAARAGLAAFTADLLDDGAGDLDGPGLADVLARIGAEADVEVWPDATVVSITTMARYADRALHLLADLLMRPHFADHDVERVRGLRLDRLRQMRVQAATLADRAFTRAIYGAHPYGHPGIGHVASVRATTAAEIRAFHHDTCTPAATSLVVAGNIAPAEAVTLVERALGAWQPAPPSGRALEPVHAEPAARGCVLVVPRQGAPQSELRIGQVSAARLTPDYHALLLWNAVLGGQFVSRLNLNLRQAKGYTYGVRSGFDFRRQRGPFSVHTSVQTTATADAVAEVLREIADLAGPRPVTADELARAKAAVGLGYPRGFETAQQVARAVAQLALHELDANHFAMFGTRLAAVQLEDLAPAANRHVNAGALTAVVVGDPDAVTPQFAARGVTVELLADEPE